MIKEHCLPDSIVRPDQIARGVFVLEVSRNEEIMEKRIALIGIIVEDGEAAERINEILHQYREYMIGRMGIPYRERNVSVISVIVDAENDIISAISGKLGMVKGVSTKTIYATK